MSQLERIQNAMERAGLAALLLMDDRYARAPYPQLLPAHWQLRRVGSLAGLQRALQAFWAEA